MFGRKGNLSQEEQDIIANISNFNPFERFSRQKCRDLFIFMQYQEKETEKNLLMINVKI